MSAPVYTAKTWRNEHGWTWRTCRDDKPISRPMTLATWFRATSTRAAALEQAKLDMEWDRDCGPEEVVLNPEAVDLEKSLRWQWPTGESTRLAWEGSGGAKGTFPAYGSPFYESLRAAMLADPIIQAAIALARMLDTDISDSNSSGSTVRLESILHQAVCEAQLL
jgi:hypothetical protein